MEQEITETRLLEITAPFSNSYFFLPEKLAI